MFVSTSGKELFEWEANDSLYGNSYLADEIYKSPMIIYDYPIDVKPFYMRLNDDGKTVAAFDMIVPKVKPETFLYEVCAAPRVSCFPALLLELRPGFLPFQTGGEVDLGKPKRDSSG